MQERKADGRQVSSNIVWTEVAERTIDDEEVGMSIQLGIYDFLSYTLPGAVYLAGTVFAVQLWTTAAIGPLPSSPAIAALLIYGAASFMVGQLMSPVSLWNPLYLLLSSAKPEVEAFEEIRATYPGTELRFKPDQWPLLQAGISLKDSALADRAEKLRATHIMLRSTSLALTLLSAYSVAYGTTHASSLAALAVLGFLALSLVAAKGSRVFAKWSYKVVFEISIAMSGRLALVGAGDVLPAVRDGSTESPDK